jgi:hypothetical protein
VYSTVLGLSRWKYPSSVELSSGLFMCCHHVSCLRIKTFLPLPLQGNQIGMGYSKEFNKIRQTHYGGGWNLLSTLVSFLRCYLSALATIANGSGNILTPSNNEEWGRNYQEMRLKACLCENKQSTNTAFKRRQRWFVSGTVAPWTECILYQELLFRDLFDHGLRSWIST